MAAEEDFEVNARAIGDSTLFPEVPPTLTERIWFLRKGLGVNRYHQRYTSVKDTVGKHSAGVAGFLILMQLPGQLPSAELMAAAICHDLPECVTGDIPSPAKRAMGRDAKEALDQQEQSLLERYGFAHNLTSWEQRQLKLADCLDGLMFCTEERYRGNKEVEQVGDVYKGYIKELQGLSTKERVLGSIVIDLWEEAKR